MRITKKKQGPVMPQCLANNISKLKQDELERILNRMAQLLAQFGPLLAALDGRVNCQLPKARHRTMVQALARKKLRPHFGFAYGTFHLAEFAVLTHVPIRYLPSSLGSPHDVLCRFGIEPCFLYQNVRKYLKCLIKCMSCDIIWV